MPTEFDKLFSLTEVHVRGLEQRLLAGHLKNPLATPDDFDLDVKSFCILCHAAFEDYVETVALKILSRAIDDFVLKHRLTDALVCLMHFKASGAGFLSSLTNESPCDRVFDYVRKKLDDVKDQFSKQIVTDNHGVSVKYCRQLLLPVGIDLIDDTILLSSLNSLADERGFYAHKYLEKGKLRRSIEPEKAKTMVDDCLKIWEDIRSKANALFP